ncbi:hypothetical protein CDO73_03250 [Saccharibacillus sp. O23]|uniref:SEC-C metal-binding domain-containing protein n=1 Tax=Saccharibacillus sp. O23 TaxID=2009338 RepID=UPI000B4E5B2A|nr:SEC-C metal-binding domain-containing protein [Saccharibacillus sp. O23]OWR32631.1 hypothetical protein CDO73_03250 [Saccharibacillus sp. O23]
MNGSFPSFSRPVSATPGRNDPCFCGSGLKYKKCCARLDEQSRSDAQRRRLLESVLRRFFDNHPRPGEQKELSAWKNRIAPRLQPAYGEEKTGSVAGDTFYFGQQVRIWNDFLTEQALDSRHAAVADALRGWLDPRFAVLRISSASAPLGAARPAQDVVQASELLNGEQLRLSTGADFRPRPGSVVLGYWIPGANPEDPLTALNSLVLIEEPEDEAVLRLERRFREAGEADAAAFYRRDPAAAYEIFAESAAGADRASGEELPQAVGEALERLEAYLIERDLKCDRLMDLAFRFLKRKREKPAPPEAAAAAVRFGQLQGWLPDDAAQDIPYPSSDVRQPPSAMTDELDSDRIEQLATEMLDYQRRTSVYREEEPPVGIRVGTDPLPGEMRQWKLYMHLKDLDIQGEAALRRQMDYFSGVPYTPASPEEEAQLRAYEAYLAIEDDVRAEKLAEARRLHPNGADTLLLAADGEADPDERYRLLEEAETAALRRFEADIEPVWLHLPNRPYLRALMLRAAHDWQTGRHAEAFERFYRLLRLNPADHQGARYPAISALIASGDHEAAGSLLAHYAEGAGDNAFYRWLEWASSYKRDRPSAETGDFYRKAVEANPYAEKYIRSRPEAEAYPRSAIITPRSPEEARLIWTLIRPTL